MKSRGVFEWYTFDQFVDYYGPEDGERRWDAAIERAQDRQEDDGDMYSFTEFLDFYGHEKGEHLCNRAAERAAEEALRKSYEEGYYDIACEDAQRDAAQMEADYDFIVHSRVFHSFARQHDFADELEEEARMRRKRSRSPDSGLDSDGVPWD